MADATEILRYILRQNTTAPSKRDVVLPGDEPAGSGADTPEGDETAITASKPICGYRKTAAEIAAEIARDKAEAEGRIAAWYASVKASEEPQP